MLVTILKALGLFAITNVDHLVVLSLFFAYGARRRHTLRRILIGQYLGFGAILAVTVAAALGARSLLPPAALPWFGLVPLAIGIHAAYHNWQESKEEDGESELEEAAEKIQARPLSVLAVAGVTFANGGDELGAYVPVFAQSDLGGIAVCCIVFLVGVAGVVWLAHRITSQPHIAEKLDRYEEILFPAVLIALGIIIIAAGLVG